MEQFSSQHGSSAFTVEYFEAVVNLDLLSLSVSAESSVVSLYVLVVLLVLES